MQVIYVIGEAEFGIVKIGHSTSPVNRLRSIQTGHPERLSILATFDGGPEEESGLHFQFADRRRAGEWFDFTDRSAVDSVATTLGVGPRRLLMEEAERRRLLRREPEVSTRRPLSLLQNATLEEIATTRDLSRSEVMALLFLVACADQDGVVVATLDQVATRLDCARGVTSQALASLVARGYLVKLKRAMYRVPMTVCLPANRKARELA